MKYLVIFVLLFVSFEYALTGTSTWSYCNFNFDAEIYANDLDNPIYVGYPVSYNLSVNLLRPMNTKIRTDITLTRYVSGLASVVRCMIVNGEQAGSCSYPDLCEAMMYVTNFSPSNCPQELIDVGIDCTCPYNLPAGRIDIMTKFETNTPAFFMPFLVRGTYVLKAEASDENGYWFCVNMNFELK